jgi:hypothetical protein
MSPHGTDERRNRKLQYTVQAGLLATDCTAAELDANEGARALGVRATRVTMGPARAA